MGQKTKSILIVDDSVTNLVLLEAVLKHKKWDIHTAISAMLAMKMLSVNKPDLILLDLLMPGIDGQEMLKRMKSNDRYKNIPVIVVSAVTDNKIRKDCLGMGAIYYMPKPIKIKQLLEIIQNTLDTCSND